jgi:hypothetical protein
MRNNYSFGASLKLVVDKFTLTTKEKPCNAPSAHKRKGKKGSEKKFSIGKRFGKTRDT